MTKAWLIFTVTGTRITGVGIYSEARPTTVRPSMYLHAEGWTEDGPSYLAASNRLRRRLSAGKFYFNPELHDAIDRLCKTGSYQQICG